MIQRRTTRRSLADTTLNTEIAGRFYQDRSIRRSCESFEDQHQSKALVVMATGAGMTTPVIALADLMIRANWAKRILFPADGRSLVNQAVSGFKGHGPDSLPVTLLTETSTDGRVYASTYPTMMNLIDSVDTLTP